MPESTTIIAFDQHADSLMAAVLPPRADKPAMQLLSSELTHVGRLRGQGPPRRRGTLLL
jgi:hypothetical protein